MQKHDTDANVEAGHEKNHGASTIQDANEAVDHDEERETDTRDDGNVEAGDGENHDASTIHGANAEAEQREKDEKD